MEGMFKESSVCGPFDCLTPLSIVFKAAPVKPLLVVRLRLLVLDFELDGDWILI